MTKAVKEYTISYSKNAKSILIAGSGSHVLRSGVSRNNSNTMNPIMAGMQSARMIKHLSTNRFSLLFLSWSIFCWMNSWP